MPTVFTGSKAPTAFAFVVVVAWGHSSEGVASYDFDLLNHRGPLFPNLFQEAERAFEQGVGRLRAELAGDKEAALSAMRRETDEELQVTKKLQVLPTTCCEIVGLMSRDVAPWRPFPYDVYMFQLFQPAGGTQRHCPTLPTCTRPWATDDVLSVFPFASSRRRIQATRKSFTEKLERALADAARSGAACAEEKKENTTLAAERKKCVKAVLRVSHGPKVFLC